MKKISGFMAALLVFVATAVAMGPVQTAQAFSESEINFQDYTWYYSAKAGQHINFSYSLEYDVAESTDVTGWTAALCPSTNKSLDAAVATFELTNADKYVNAEYSTARLSKYVTLGSDIPEGYYCQVFFDGNGAYVGDNGYTTLFINKSLVSFECSLMNNDGYAYAYVYSENLPLSADTYPTFYAADKSTEITSFNNYAVEKNRYGNTVHIYRLNILDASQFELDSDGLTYLCYKFGTPNVELTISGNDAGNDGGIGVKPSDSNGFSWTYAYNVNNYVQKYNLGYEVTNPFDKAAADNSTDNSADNSADDDDDDNSASSSNVTTATATVGEQKVSVSVTSIQNSEVPAIQTAINNVVSWTSQVATQPTEVVKVLNQYAPSMKIDGVTAGGTLDLAVPAGTDISSGVRITFSDGNISANVKSGDKIVVLHIKHDGSIEYIPAEAGDGTITATFTSLSPVAWFKVNASGNSNSISPKTGLSFWNFLMELFH